jgi:hypothetical protein
MAPYRTPPLPRHPTTEPAKHHPCKSCETPLLLKSLPELHGMTSPLFGPRPGPGQRMISTGVTRQQRARRDFFHNPKATEWELSFPGFLPP